MEKWILTGRQRIFLMLWTLAPAITSVLVVASGSFWISLLRGSAVPHALDGLRLIFPLYGIVLPAVAVIVFAAFLFTVLRQDKRTGFFRLMCLGLACQTLLLIIADSSRLLYEWAVSSDSVPFFETAPRFITLLLSGTAAFTVPTILSQLLFVGLFAAFLRFHRLSKPVALLLAFVFLLGIEIGFWSGLAWYSNQGFIRSTEKRNVAREEQLIREHTFREAAKQATWLGSSIKRPYRIFRRGNGTFFALDADAKEIALPSFVFPDRDEKRGLFVDVFGDRVFYQKKDGTVVMSSPASGSAKTLTGDIVGFAIKPACSVFGCDSYPVVNGAHRNDVAMERGASAATGNVGIFDTQTGQRVIMSSYAGYDSRRAYQFWIDGQGYRLILNASELQTAPVMKRGGIAQRTWQQETDTLRFYLDRFGGGPYEVPEDDFFPADFSTTTRTPGFPWTDITFRGGPSEYLENRIPFFRLRSSVQNPAELSFFEVHLFSVRNLYKLDASHAGLEVNEGLVVIDLAGSTALFVTDAQEIERMLATALLIVPDDETLAHSGFCPEHNDTLNRMEKEDVKFEACVY